MARVAPTREVMCALLVEGCCNEVDGGERRGGSRNGDKGRRIDGS